MRITFLGDIMVKPEQLSSYEKNGKYDFTEALQNIKSEFSDSDYIVGNLETPVADEMLGYTNEPYCFNTPTEIIQNLKECGVNMVTTANNHCLDRGIEGIRNTIDNLEKCGLDYVGTHKQRENSFIIKEIEGIKIAFLAFSYGTNAFSNNEY